VTWIRGTHSLKTGFDLNFDNIFNFFPGNFGGRYTFSSVASLGRGLPNGSGENYQQAFAGVGTTGPETHPDLKEYAVFLQDEWKASRKLTLSFGLRYDLQDIAQPDVRNPDPQLAAAGIDTSFIHVDKNNFAPRGRPLLHPGPEDGGARRLRPLLRTDAIDHDRHRPQRQRDQRPDHHFHGRAGAEVPGRLHDHPDRSGPCPGPPSSSSILTSRTRRCTRPASASSAPLGTNVSLAVSYMYVAGRKLALSRDFNVGDPVPTAIPIQGGGSLTVDRFPTRPFSNFDRLVRFESTGRSNYNGGTFELKKRWGGGVLASFAYTLSSVKDNNPDSVNVVLGGGDDARFPSHPTNRDADYAAGQNDVRHRLVFSGYWNIDYFKDSGGVAKALLNDWSLSWIATAYSGYPYSERIVNDANNDGNRNNDLVPGSRDSHRLPWTKNIDMRLSRRIPLGKQVKLELIAEAFNLLNSTNISVQNSNLYNFTNGVLIPQTNLSNTRSNFGFDAGTAVNFEDTQRIVQLAAKITF
jgi:hypothetical protein